MQKIDWEAVRKLLPIDHYVYHVEGEGETVEEFWYPYNPTNKTFLPPQGWVRIVYKETAANLMNAVDKWLDSHNAASLPKPEEKAVWYDNSSGTFSNAFNFVFDEKMMQLIDHADKHNHRLIVFRCINDQRFEFSDMMRIVTNTERRK